MSERERERETERQREKERERERKEGERAEKLFWRGAERGTDAPTAVGNKRTEGDRGERERGRERERERERVVEIRRV